MDSGAGRLAADQHVCVLKVISPVGSDLPLAPDVPHVQLKPLRLDTLDVKALRGGQRGTRKTAGGRSAPALLRVEACGTRPYLRGGDVADVLGRQLFEQGGLAPVVQAQQQDPNLLVWRALQFAQDGQQTLQPFATNQQWRATAARLCLTGYEMRSHEAR